MADKRATPRHRTLKSGLIAFNNSQSTISCTVRNLSDGGADLKVASVLGIPDEFELRLSDHTKHQCTVVWKKVDEIGVKFE